MTSRAAQTSTTGPTAVLTHCHATPPPPTATPPNTNRSSLRLRVLASAGSLSVQQQIGVSCKVLASGSQEEALRPIKTHLNPLTGKSLEQTTKFQEDQSFLSPPSLPNPADGQVKKLPLKNAQGRDKKNTNICSSESTSEFKPLHRGTELRDVTNTRKYGKKKLQHQQELRLRRRL